MEIALRDNGKLEDEVIALCTRAVVLNAIVQCTLMRDRVGHWPPHRTCMSPSTGSEVNLPADPWSLKLQSHETAGHSL